MDKSERKALEDQAKRLVSEFLTRSREAGVYKRDHIARLVELATSEEADAASVATGAIFTLLVEPLADSFEAEAVPLYNRMFAQLVQFCRGAANGLELHQELVGFGLTSEDDLNARAEALRRVVAAEDFRLRTVKRVVVLSRVTLGADVAITSVIMGRLKQLFPGADITLLGARKTMELFGGDSRLSLHETNYRQAGTLTERLLNWIDVLTSVRVLTQGLRPGDFLIVDPDTRLTQLGVLPLGGGERQAPKGTGELRSAALQPRDPIASGYLFFPSREYDSESSHSLSRLASMWLTEVFGQGEPCLPRVDVPPAHSEPARALVQLLKRTSGKPVVSINFGVGQNPSKRVGDQFEQALVARLIQQGHTVILDKGAGPDENAWADALVTSAIRAVRGVKLIDTMEPTLKRLASSDRLEADIVVWQGRIGVLAGLIGESDLYIGYDSAGQHIAAALGVPTIDVFAGFASRRFVERWKPTGPAASRVLAASSPSNPEAVVDEVLRHANEIMRPH